MCWSVPLVSVQPILMGACSIVLWAALSLMDLKLCNEFEHCHETSMKPVYNFYYKAFSSIQKLTIFMDVSVFEMRKLSTYRD
mgnify:FL=1